MVSTFDFLSFSILSHLFFSTVTLFVKFSYSSWFLESTTSLSLSLDKLKVLSFYYRYGFLLRPLFVLVFFHILEVRLMVTNTTFNGINNTMGVNKIMITTHI